MSPFDFASPLAEASDLTTLQEHFHRMGWTDGLPVIPPTPELVAGFLKDCGAQPTDVITVIPTRGRTITAEDVAINGVMAGCRPDYMPVVIAVLQAMSEPHYNFHGSITSTGGSAQFIVVNGPIRNALGMNSGVNVFGPGNRANATIGRAVRLILINTAGAQPGVLDKSTQGHPGKYSYCIAEAEERSPWEPLHVEYGYDPEISTVTVFAGESAHNIQSHTTGDPEQLMTCLAREMASIGAFSLGQSGLVLCPEHADIIARSGWSKREIKAFLFEQATQSVADLKRLGKVKGELKEADAGKLVPLGLRPGDHEYFKKMISLGGELTPEDETRFISRGLGPDDILLVVAGGEAGGHSAFIPSWSRARGSLFQTKPIGVCIDCNLDD